MTHSIFERWKKDEAEVPVHEETIEFFADDKHYEFRLIHNFHIHHLDIYKAFEEWTKQTKNVTIEDFCQYVMLQPSDKTEIICFPEDTWKEFQLNQDPNLNLKT